MNSEQDSPSIRDSKSKDAITRLLIASQNGDKTAMNQLVPMVYEEMHSLARRKLQFERSNHTLNTTALVHEAYLRLINQDKVQWQSRSHFLAIASQAMRRILINYAEKRKAVKRGGKYSKIDTNIEEVADESDQIGMNDAIADEVLKMHKALTRMETFNERGCRVVEYRFFGGLTWKEIAEELGTSQVTVRRAWNVARLWLRREMSTIKLQ